MDRQKQIKEMQKAMREHERKLKTDPEYRKKSDEIEMVFRKNLYGYGKKKS